MRLMHLMPSVYEGLSKFLENPVAKTFNPLRLNHQRKQACFALVDTQAPARADMYAYTHTRQRVGDRRMEGTSLLPRGLVSPD